MMPEELRTIRSRLDETQTGLARRLGVALRTLQQWEAGDRKIPEIAVKLLATLKVRSRRKSDVSPPAG